MNTMRRPGRDDGVDFIFSKKIVQKLCRRPHPENPWIGNEKVSPDPGTDGLKGRLLFIGNQIRRLRRFLSTQQFRESEKNIIRLPDWKANDLCFGRNIF